MLIWPKKFKMLIWPFGNIEIEKNKFYCNKTRVFLKDKDIEKVLVSKNLYFDEKKL